MNHKDKSLRLVRIALVAACMVISASTSKAALIYHVDVNTAPLVGSLSGPFSLDFQLNGGSLTVFNAVTLSNFVFTGGNPTGLANLSGDATGSLSSTVTLTDDTAVFNEFYQGFSAGTTEIRFDVLLTTNLVPGPTPDAFSMAILDNTLSNIPTTDPSLGDSLMLVNIDSSSLSLSDVQKFTSTSPFGVSIVPEPSSWLFMGSGLLALGWLALRRNIKGGIGKTA